MPPDRAGRVGRVGRRGRVGRAGRVARVARPAPPDRPPLPRRATGESPGVADPRAELLDLIKDLAVVHGRVTLSSGREADYYVDLRRVTLHHRAAPLVGEVMLDTVADWQFDAVGGLTLGADPVSSAMMHSAAARGQAVDAVVVRNTG